jgi:hypothetical protein
MSYTVREMEAQRYLEELDRRIKEFLPENVGEAAGSGSSTVVADNYMGSFKAGERLGSVNSNGSQNMYDLPHVSLFTIETLSENKYRSKLKQLRDMLEKMTRDWNADERNRD